MHRVQLHVQGRCQSEPLILDSVYQVLPLNVTAICEAHSAQNISREEHSDCTNPKLTPQ